MSTSYSFTNAELAHNSRTFRHAWPERAYRVAPTRSIDCARGTISEGGEVFTSDFESHAGLLAAIASGDVLPHTSVPQPYPPTVGRVAGARNCLPGVRGTVLRVGNAVLETDLAPEALAALVRAGRVSRH
jgi:hypothetical protein